MVGAFAAQAAVILERHRLTEAAAAAVPIAEGDRMRTALLAAVGHDLRTPLASAKAAVTSLRSNDIEWSAEDHDELLVTADESLDRLTRLVDNLLDMSRLQAGALSVVSRSVALDEVVPLALDDLGTAGRSVVVDVPDDLPEVLADPGLLERVVANLVGNAIRYSPAGTPPRHHRQQPRRPGRAAGHRPRPRHPVDGPGPGLRALPAPRRHRQHDRGRPRAGPLPRAHRGHGRHAHPGGDTRRRTHDGRVLARVDGANEAPAAHEPGRREREGVDAQHESSTLRESR